MYLFVSCCTVMYLVVSLLYCNVSCCTVMYLVVSCCTVMYLVLPCCSLLYFNWSISVYLVFKTHLSSCSFCAILTLSLNLQLHIFRLKYKKCRIVKLTLYSIVDRLPSILNGVEHTFISVLLQL